jgi:transcriptional regulator with XRE-family HTH domain
MRRPAAGTRPDAPQVLGKAILRAGQALGLTQKDLAAVLGVSEASVSRLPRGRGVDPASKEGELALLLLRVYRSLSTLVGGRDDAARDWMRAENDHLNGPPARLARSAAGLVAVADYLDGMRGKL